MIVIINPNSTVSMTETMVETARAAAPGHTFEGWTSHLGPASIQGAEDGEACTPPLLALVAQASEEGAQAIIIGCFDDTGLAEARAIAACPVIGIGQAAYHVAALAGDRFSVVTTLAVSIPVLEANIRAYGFGDKLVQVRASGVPVLDLERNPVSAQRRVADEVLMAMEQDNVDSVIMGCAGMSSLFETLERRSDVVLIDGVQAAARLSTMFERLPQHHKVKTTVTATA